ncbi:hypothetical protein JMUB7533_26960 [Staphylococcus aureus]
MAKLNVEVFADGADIEEMKAAYKNKQVDGFTTVSYTHLTLPTKLEV